MKVQVMMSDDLVKRIDAIANSIGVSRSSYCAVLIGQGLLAQEKAIESLARSDKFKKGVSNETV